MKKNNSNQTQKNRFRFVKSASSVILILFLISYPTFLPIMVAQADENSVENSADSPQTESKGDVKNDDSSSADTPSEDSDDSKKTDDSASKSAASSNENPKNSDSSETAATMNADDTQTQNDKVSDQNAAVDTTVSETKETTDQNAVANSQTPEQTQSSDSSQDQIQPNNQTEDSLSENSCACQTPLAEENTEENTAACCQNQSDKLESFNDAGLSNEIQAVSNTGDNQLNPQSTENAANADGSADADKNQDRKSDPAASNSSADITTGDANSQAVIVNELNTNIVSFNEVESIINLIGLQTDDVDLAAIFQKLLENSAKANSDALSGLTIVNDNTANVQNEADASANSGNNSVTAENATRKISLATIQTGDADASADIVNILNQNFVGNNWLFSIINIFGTWTGNLIVPAKDLLTVPEGLDLENIALTNENNAIISNILTSDAQAGNNSITQTGKNSNGQTSISTGQAQATSNAITLANTNITQNNWFFLMINNMGIWTGRIIGWNGATQNYQSIYSFDFNQTPQTDTDPQNETPASSMLSISNTNDADVSNLASAQANTGNNEISATGKETVSVTTGNANARANIFNLINTNIVGNNWLFAIVNIMGKWTGNTVFVHPVAQVDQTSSDELTVPTDSATDSSSQSLTDENDIPDSTLQIKHGTVDSAYVKPGAIVQNSIRVKNTGETTLSDITITDSIKNPTGEKISAYAWPIEKLKKGEEILIQYQLQINPDASPGEYSFNAQGIAYDESNEKINSNLSKSYLSIAKRLLDQTIAQTEENLLTPSAQAAENDNDSGRVLGQENHISSPQYFSFLILIVSMAAYFFFNHKLSEASGNKKRQNEIKDFPLSIKSVGGRTKN